MTLSDPIRPNNPLLPLRLYTILQVATLCAASEKTVRRWIHRRQLAAHKLGGLWRIAEADLKLFLHDRRQS